MNVCERDEGEKGENTGVDWRTGLAVILRNSIDLIGESVLIGPEIAN